MKLKLTDIASSICTEFGSDYLEDMSLQMDGSFTLYCYAGNIMVRLTDKGEALADMVEMPDDDIEDRYVNGPWPHDYELAIAFCEFLVEHQLARTFFDYDYMGYGCSEPWEE